MNDTESIFWFHSFFNSYAPFFFSGVGIIFIVRVFRELTHL